LTPFYSERILAPISAKSIDLNHNYSTTRRNTVRNKVSTITIGLLALVACLGLSLAPKKQAAVAQSGGKIKIMDYPQAFQGREPIKLKDLGGLTLEIKNASKQGITKFVLYFVAAKGDLPLHGQGAHRHTFPIYWGYDGAQLLPAGETVQISLEEGMKAHTSNPDANPNNTEIWAFEVHFEGADKMWRMGKFLKKSKSGKKWEEDVSLNPPRPKLPKGASLLAASRPQFDGRCYHYDESVEWPKTLCNGTPCPECKYSAPQFKMFYGGYPLVLTCVYCLNNFNTVCQKPNGQSCTWPNINDLDYANPCTY
jgi:hypothetical protein